jgi:hypothetical protein
MVAAMKRVLPLLAAFFLGAVSATLAAPQPHRWAIGGVTTERSSMVFVDLAAPARSGDKVRTPVMLVLRDPRPVGDKTTLYSTIDGEFDCQAATLRFISVSAYSGEGELVETVSAPGPALPLQKGTSFGASWEVACSSRPRAVDAPMFATDALALDYAQRLLHGQAPSDRTS